MVGARHKTQTIAEGIHTPISFEYANEAARLAAGPFQIYDKNKFALQLDTNQIYVLIDTSPIVWSSVSGPGISGDLDMDGYDIIDVGTVDGVDVSAHAGRHEAGGADAIEVADLGTAEVNVLLVLQPDGVGGVVWSVPPGGGDVVGPAGATDNAVALFDAGTGKVLKNSLVTIDGAGNISTPGTVDGYALGTEFYNINTQLDILGGILGGDLSGTLPNPTVVDLSITAEEQGSVLYFDGANWVQLPPGTDGYALITHDTGANPTWGEVASSSPITSVFGRVGDVIASIDDYSASQIDNNSTVSGEQVSDALEYLDGYVASVAQDVADIGTMAVSGDLSGNLPNPSVVDLSITGEEQGSVLYFDGTNWVQLPPGSDGYALITHDTGANPTWGEVATTAPVTSVFGRVGDVIAVVDDYSASQIDNNSTVPGGQVSDALDYLDGYVDHATRHENGGADEIEISNLGTSEVNTLLVLQPDGVGGVVWSVAGGGGDVVGPAGATDNAVALFDAGTGKVIKNSLVTIDGAGNITTPGTVDGYALGSEFYDINTQLDILGGILGGDLSGTLPNPSVVDLSIAGEEQGSILYYNGANWVQLPPGEDGYALITHDTGVNPTWGEVASSAPVTSVFGRTGDVIAVTDDYSASEVDNDSTVTGEQVSDALEYLDGYIGGHIVNVNNPHQTSIGNIVQGTLAELNLAISDATLDDISGIRTPTAHATSHEEGEADAIDGYQIGIAYVPVNYVAPINPIIGEHIAAIDDALASSGLVDSVFGRIGDVVAAIDDYSASQIDNDSAVTGEQVSNALEYLDGYVGSHIVDLNNPHQTSISNIGSGTLAELNLAISDATLDDVSGTRTPTSHATSHEEGEADAIDGYQVEINYVPVNYAAPVNPIIGEHIAAIDDALASSGLVDSVFGRIGNVVATTDDYSASQIDNDSTVSGEQVSDALEYLDGYIGGHVVDLNNPHQTNLGNIGSGTLAELNLAISDATLDDVSGTRAPTAHATSHEEGESDAIDGYQVQLNYVPVNYVAPVNPIIGEHISAIDNALASSGLVDSVFGRIGDVVAAIDDYSASQIDNDSTVTGGQVSDALEYLDGYIKDHSYSHENGGGDEIEISNLGTSELNNTLVLMPDGVGGVVWSVPSGGGDVSGPAGATDNAVALFDAGTGKVIKNSLVTIDGSGNISTPGTVDGYALGSEFYDINAQLDILGGILGGDLSGTLPNPSVVDLTIAAEEQGSVLYFDGSNWVQLPPGSDGYALITHDTGANPTWGEVATTAPVTSVFGRVGDVVAGIDDYSASQIDNDSTVTGEQVSDALEYLDGYIGGLVSVGGDLFGNLPNPSVVDLTIIGEEQGSVLYFNGANWVQLPPGSDGYALITHDTGANPTWGEVSGSSVVDSVFGRVGDIVATIDDYSASQIDNDSTVAGEQVSDALEYLDGYIGGHVLDFNNPHQTSISNIGSGTLAELNLAISDATLDDVSGTRTPTAHATSHEEGETDAIDGYQVGISYVPVNYTAPVNPIIGEHIAAIDEALASAGPVDSVFGRVGDIVSAVDDYSASQIDNDSTVTGEQVSDALEYLDGYIKDHSASHENGGGDEIEISNLGTSEVNNALVLKPDGVGGVVWSVAAGGGDVVGPAGATADAIALFDGGTGKAIKNSLVTIDGSGNISTPGTVDGYALGTEFYDINAQLDILGGSLGGDLSGTLPNPTVTDLSITSEEQGSVLYFDGANWVQLPPGDDGYVLTTHDTGADPTWEEAGGSGSGDVVGPAIATDNAIVRYDGSTGELVQNSGVLVDNSDNISGVESLAIGDKPAQIGAIRLTNNEGIYWAGTGEVSFPGDRVYKLQIDIQQSLVTGDPVNDLWVRITHQSLPDAMLTSGGIYAPQAGGGDIGASLDEFGLTRIPLYVTRCDLDPNPANSRVQIWVRRQDVSDTVDTPIWLWWGDAAATPPAVDAPYGRDDVFGSTTGTGAPPDGWGVWLFDEDPAGSSPQYKDHTGSGHDAEVGGTVTRVDSMDVRGAQIVAGAGWISSAYTWAPGTNDFSILWAGVLGTAGQNWMEGDGDTRLVVAAAGSGEGIVYVNMGGISFGYTAAPTTASCVGFVRDGDNAEIHINTNTESDTGWSAANISWDSSIKLSHHYAEGGIFVKTFVAFVDTAVNPYWFRAFDSCIINETSFLVAGVIEEAAPAVPNVRGILVDPSNNIVLGDADYPLVGNATDSVTFNVDGYSVSIYDGYVDIVNHDIRNIKTATFNEWPTLTPDEDGYVTVDFGSYQKASIDLNDEASVCIVLSNPLGPGSFTIILQQGDSVGSTISDWQVSNAIYGPSGVIGYSTGLGSITLVKLEYNGSDWFVVSTQSMEPV